MSVWCFLPNLKYSGHFEIKASSILGSAKTRNAEMKISVNYFPHSHIKLVSDVSQVQTGFVLSIFFSAKLPLLQNRPKFPLELT